KRYRYSSLGIVLSGSFEYYAGNGAGIAVPGTLLLGNPDETFRCVHRSGAGNWRQVTQFESAYLDAWADELGLGEGRFRAALHPPGELSAAIFGCMHRLSHRDDEAGCELVALALQVNRRPFVPRRVSVRNRQRVLALVNHLERHYAEDWSLKSMARLSNL